MTVEQTNVVDIAHIDRESGDVFLSISDHLEWDEDGEHLLLLQNKINMYVHFVESGEIYERFPQYAGKKVVIEVINKYPLDEEAILFFRLAQDAIKGAGIKLQNRHPPYSPIQRSS
jgi:hypothetical protein